MVFSFDLKQILSIPSRNISNWSMTLSEHTIAKLGNSVKVLLLIVSEQLPLRSFNNFSMSSLATFGINSTNILLWVFINTNFSWIFLTWTRLSKYCLRHKLISNLVFSSNSPKLWINAIIIFSLISTSKLNPLAKIFRKSLDAARLTFHAVSSKFASNSTSSYSSYPSISTFSPLFVLPGSYFNNSVASSIIWGILSLKREIEVDIYISKQFRVASTKEFFSLSSPSELRKSLVKNVLSNDIILGTIWPWERDSVCPRDFNAKI